MRTLCSIFIYLVIFVFVDFRLNAQVYEPEGINIPGAWNNWTNSNDASTMDNFRLQKRNFGGGQYTTTLQISSDLSQTPDATPGTYEWLFTSGPNTGLYNNKWGTSSEISFVTMNPVFHQGANNTTTVEDNSYYTITFKDQGYTNTDFSIQKLSQQPITFENIIGVPTTSVSPSTSVDVKVILSSSKASEEKIYLRYSIDDFVTSSAIEFTSFNGDTGIVKIPAITSNNNTIVKFYILSTTVDKSLWGQNVDLFTLSYLNNSSSNYTYTVLELPSQVSLSSPSDDASGVVLQPTLSWSSSARSTEYDMQVSLDSSFNDTSKFALVRENISANIYSIKNPLEYGNNYFWRVRGTNTTGDGDWSSVWDFWTDFRPNLELPLNGSTKISTPVKLKWGMQVKSNYFDIQIAQDKSFDDLTINLIDYDSTQIIISDLNDNELYYWRVRAKVSKTITYWSDIYSFSTTQLKPDTVIAESPVDSTNDASIPVAFSWRQAYLANSYQLQISDSNGFSFFSDTSVTDTTILLSNFNSGTDYYWRIRSVNDSGFSSWSVINNLNIGVGGFEGPLLIFPDNNAVDLGEQLKLTWETMKGADNYQLQIAYSNDFVDIFIDTTEVMDEELLVQGLENGMNYFWRVRATDSESASTWSEVYSFSTAILPPNKISIIQPASSSEDIDLPVTFIWKQAVTADYYELKFGDTKELSNSITLSDITDTTVTLENLNYDSRYFWKVRGINLLDNGPWSEVYSFSTGLPIPDFPVLVHPQNDDDLRPPIRFGWNSTEFTDSYHLQVSQDELFKNIVFDSTLSKQTVEIAALDEIKKYYWRLKSINRLFTSEWSEVRNFNLISLTNTEDELVIEEFALHQNFPNPFNPSTVITFDVKNVQDVKVQVFDLSGRLVKTLVNNKTSPGRHQVVFDASTLSSGVYLLRMQAGYFIDTKKITLIK